VGTEGVFRPVLSQALSRREVGEVTPMGRALVATGAIGLALLLAISGTGQEATVKIGFLGPLSGPFAIWGVNARDAMRMAASEINEAGGVAGRRVQIVERDDRNSPAEAVTALRALVERERVVAAGGLVSSDVGLAVSREAELLKVPVFLTMAGSHAILRRETRFTFRTCLVPAPSFIDAVFSYVRYRRLSRVGALVADYAWGHAIREALEQQARRPGGARLHVEIAPVGTSDFTPYLRRLQGFGPELIVATGHPPGQPVIVRQAAELGMGQLIVGSSQVPEVMVQRAGEAVFGRFLDYSCVDFTSRAFREMASKYYGLYKRHFDGSAFSGYVIVKLVAEAVSRTGSSSAETVAGQIRRARFVHPAGAFALAYTEWGELREARPVFYTIERGEAPEGVCPGCGWAQKYQFRSEPIRAYVPGE
jgi:branched-chain amino acid transport system substrate-binding protein